MRVCRFLGFAFVFVFIFVAMPLATEAQSCSSPYFVEQGFPVAGPEETKWRICWQMQHKFGLVITSAHFRKSPTSPWIRVFWDARVAEIFVPYHDDSDRFYDIMGFDWNWVKLAAADCPVPLGGTLLGAGPDACKQVRDRGFAWKKDDKLRRGEELVLWGAIAAANYNYITEWTFRDDGVILGRVGATGLNYPPHPFVNHVHDPIWRLDIDLDGFAGDSVHLGTHTEFVPAPGKATDTEPMIPSETGLDWDPGNFTSLQIHDKNLKNAKGNPSGYHLIPLPTGGLSRHQEDFTKHDFWVTLYNPTEIFAAKLPSYIKPPQSVENADVVVWYKGSMHHIVRDEDGEIIKGFWSGEAHVMWSGFMLKPHNLFDRTPLFP